jgi:hypothetical protein
VPVCPPFFGFSIPSRPPAYCMDLSCLDILYKFSPYTGQVFPTRLAPLPIISGSASQTHPEVCLASFLGIPPSVRWTIKGNHPPSQRKSSFRMAFERPVWLVPVPWMVCLVVAPFVPGVLLVRLSDTECGSV